MIVDVKNAVACIHKEDYACAMWCICGAHVTHVLANIISTKFP